MVWFAVFTIRCNVSITVCSEAKALATTSIGVLDVKGDVPDYSLPGSGTSVFFIVLSPHRLITWLLPLSPP